MDETNITTNKEVETTNVVPESGYNPPPPASYSFENPVGLTKQNEPPPAYTTSTLFVPPPGIYSQPIRAQPMPIRMSNQVVGPSYEAANINDYMAWSVFNCICCCWPFGIIALILSCVVSEKKKSDNLASAKRLSTSTAVWNGITTVLGIALNIFAIIYYTQL